MILSDLYCRGVLAKEVLLDMNTPDDLVNWLTSQGDIAINPKELLLPKSRKKDIPTIINQQQFTVSALGSKLSSVCCLIDYIRKEGERCIIFCNYTTPLYLLLRYLSIQEVPSFILIGLLPCQSQCMTISNFIFYCMFLGKVDPEERLSLLQRFANSQAGVLLSSIKVGGVGLNLHIACCAILLNEDWNPQVDQQVCIIYYSFVYIPIYRCNTIICCYYTNICRSDTNICRCDTNICRCDTNICRCDTNICRCDTNICRCDTNICRCDTL